MWGKVACHLGLHDWSEWKPLDPDEPSEQVRICSRCGHMESNTPSDFGMAKYPPNSDRAWIGGDITSHGSPEVSAPGIPALMNTPIVSTR